MMAESWFIHTSKNPGTPRLEQKGTKSEEAVPPKGPTRGGPHVVQKKERERAEVKESRSPERRAESEREREESRIKIEVHCGRRFFALSASTSAYGENFIFVHFSSPNQFQKLDYFYLHKASPRGSRPFPRGLLRSCYTYVYTYRYEHTMWMVVISFSKINVLWQQACEQDCDDER